MMVAAASPEDATPSPSRSSVATTKRKVLGETSTAPIKPSRSSRTASISSTTAALTSSSSQVETARPKPNGRMQIFVDPTSDETHGADENGATPWDELGSRKARVKENLLGVSKMKGATVKQPGMHQRAPSSSTGASRIAVFRDPALTVSESMPPPPVPAPKTPARASFVPLRDETERQPERPGTPRFMPYQDEVRLSLQFRWDSLRRYFFSPPRRPPARQPCQVAS
jgi:hypothetical protein